MDLREAALTVADIVIKISADKRWTSQHLSRRTLDDACRILVLERQMGPVCEEAYALPIIAQMTELALRAACALRNMTAENQCHIYAFEWIDLDDEHIIALAAANTLIVQEIGSSHE